VAKTIKNLFTCIEETKEAARFAPHTPCWRWLGSCTKAGYGLLNYVGRKGMAHRLSFMLRTGQGDAPMVCHTCDNKWCVNPDHLFAGNSKINAMDRIKWKVKLSLDDMAKIKESPLPSYTLAKQWGLSIRQIEAIRPMRLYKGRFHGKISGRFSGVSVRYL